MKIHPDTFTILKHFSRIHKSLTVPAGRVLTTITPQKTVVARAETPTDFPRQFSIFDLNRFLSVASLFGPDAEYAFGDEGIDVSEDGRSATYRYADDAVIKTKPPQGEIKFPSVDAEFRMSATDYRTLMKAAGVLGLEQVAVVGDGGATYLRALDAGNPLADRFSIRVGDAERDFVAVIKRENLDLFPSDYVVTVTRRGMARFVGSPVTSWVALESESKFAEEPAPAGA